MGSHCEEKSKLKLISKCFVKPTNNKEESPKKPIHLGVTDLFMLTMDTMQKGLLFNTKLQPNTLTKLKKSLSISLEHFYPLAGRLATQKFYDEHACCFYVDSEAGSGASLTHATVEYTALDIASSVDVHPIVQYFFDVGEKSVNHDGHTRPLLSVQVTELLDGVFIGFTMNHVIADGTSLWHFISTLSEIFGQLEDDVKSYSVSISRKPIFETLFPLNGYHTIYKMPYLEPDEFLYRYDPGPLRVRLFHFSSKSISTIKAQSNEECRLQNTISSFQALCGFIWRSIMRARNLQPEEETGCGVVMNARTRLDPPLPPEYFRCLLSGVQGVSKAGELMNNGLGQAALIIHQCIKAHDQKAYIALINQVEAHPSVIKPGPKSPYYKRNCLTIGGSNRFDMYGPEFGLGRAVAVLAGYASKEDGKVTVNPGREGGGSVDLEICLKPETMNALQLDQEFMNFVSSV